MMVAGAVRLRTMAQCPDGPGRINPKTMETKQFPNGFASWMKTHHEVVSVIATQLLNPEDWSHIVRHTYEMQGTIGLYTLAEQITDKFERLNEGREWDGEFLEEVYEFMSSRLNAKA